MVAVTVLVAPSITDTVLPPGVGHVDGVRGRVHPDPVRVGAHADGGGDGVGGPVDHRHGVAAEVGHVDGVGGRVHPHRDRVAADADGGGDGVGRRWQTVICRPVSAAKAASSVFHSRVRYPLDPPPSALISSRCASVERLDGLVLPVRIVSTVKRPCRGRCPRSSAGVDGDVVHPVGGHLAELLVDEVMDVHRLGGALGLPFGAALLERPDVFLLLGVHADHRSPASMWSLAWALM